MSAEVISAFADLGYNFTGTDTKSMIIEFQIDNNIIPSRDDEAAGIYGPKTRSTLASLHAAYTARRQKELDLIDIAKKALLKDHENYNSEYSDAQSRVISFGQPRLKQSGDNIARLQEFLIAGRYYTSSVDSQMSPRTLIALRKYQRSKDIRPTGSLDESTRSAMIDDIVSL
jgi:peptidoglycan hydrolase-like protein with peptidoglycan-binding domain